jgi:nucleotide-binding universal stress UspA family protein
MIGRCNTIKLKMMEGIITMYKRILVPTDGSESSRLAFSHAIKLAKISGAEIFLLHVTFTPQVYWGNNLAYGVTINEKELQELGNNIIEATLKDIETDSKVTTIIVSGSPAQKILKLINEKNIDLVIMGSHGHGPFSGAFLGSVSQRVLAKATCPVMVTKDLRRSETREP